MQEFREVFQHEIQRHLAKLSRRSLEKSRCQSESSPKSFAETGGSPTGQLSVRTAESCSLELAHLGELERLATEMTESVLRRVAKHPAAWEPDRDSAACAGASAAEAALFRAADAERATAHERLEARRLELEAQLKALKAEEARVRPELLARCKALFDAALATQEQELLDVRRAAVAESTATSEVIPEELRRELTERCGRIQSHLKSTEEVIRQLDSRARSIERVEGQQSRPLPPVEALLLGMASDGADALDDEQDRALCEAIKRGEQVCKRVRRHLAGA